MSSDRKKLIKRIVFFTVLLTPLFFLIYLAAVSTDRVPSEISSIRIPQGSPTLIEGNMYGIGKNRFRHSQSGLYELFVEGTPIEIGTYGGRLTKDLVVKQEKIFVSMINRFLPGDFYRFLIKKFVLLFNKPMGEHIQPEYLHEIYGISASIESDIAGIGSPYFRVLNYHAAHDIGHMVNNMNLVGCTAFAVWNSKSGSGDLITGRNFDFFIGDRFAKDRIVAFVRPEKGIPFAMVTWGGMIGTVSGMNLSGLSVTLNAAKSGIPFRTATPVSLVAREILQYADTVDKAFEIAKSRDIFVSQMFFISSARDGKAAVIEKTPEMTELSYSGKDYFAITNHFTGKMKGTEKDQSSESMKMSQGRLNRVVELLEKREQFNVPMAVSILRDTKGYGDTNVEPGSELAINQYLAHHSVVFNNTKRTMFVSTYPWQFGPYRAYELEKVFNEFPGMMNDREISSSELTIPADPFMDTDEFRKVKRSRDDGTFKTDDIRFRKDGLNM